MEVKGTITRKVIQHLLENITNGTWTVGQRISSENLLSQELGVSRVTVRSAIQQLTSMGILESVRGKGTYLISDDISAFEVPKEARATQEGALEILNVLELRALIEPQVCEKVAGSASAELIARLQSLLDTMRNSVGNSRAFVSADQKFHLEICSAYGNPVVEEVLRNTFRERADPHYMVSLNNGFYGGIYYHGLILDAIRKHDEKRARLLMSEHLQHGAEELRSILEEKLDAEQEK